MDEVNLNPLDYRKFLKGIEDCKEQIKYYENVIADVVLRNSNLEVNDSVKLENKGGINKLYGVVVGAKAVIKADNEVHKLMNGGIIVGGMLPKVEACMVAINAGVSRSHILDGRIKHSLLLEIFTDEGIGTMIVSKTKEERLKKGSEN